MLEADTAIEKMRRREEQQRPASKHRNAAPDLQAKIVGRTQAMLKTMELRLEQVTSYWRERRRHAGGNWSLRQRTVEHRC